MNFLCFTALPSPPAAAAAAAQPQPPLPEVAGPQEFHPSPPTPFRTTCSSLPISLSQYPCSNSITNRGLYIPLRRPRLQINCPQVSHQQFFEVAPAGVSGGRRHITVMHVYLSLICHHISMSVYLSLHLCMRIDAEIHRPAHTCMLSTHIHAYVSIHTSRRIYCSLHPTVPSILSPKEHNTSWRRERWIHNLEHLSCAGG